VTTVRVTRITDFEALGARWRDLEQRADASFFQTWSWTGCLAAERFTNPVLVEATEAGRTVALALFNRRQGKLYLGETGDPALDCPYIEHNGVLAETARTEELTQACLAAVARSHVLVLSGIDEPTLRAASSAAGQVWIAKHNDSPFLDLTAIRRSGGDYLVTRSANTRQQIRRSERFYAGLGPLTVRRPTTIAEAHAMLDAMAVLHQATWTARGKPGSFAQPFFARFHHALIDIAFPRGEIDLFTLSAGDTTVGILYNLRDRTGVRAYQSGFDYHAAGQSGKPGLSCHYAAIRDALTQPIDVYDFLAGDDRYKRSLAGRSAPQYWIEAGPLWSARLLARRIHQMFGRRRGGAS
jgi:CelD/BcsL family acetyltransferase involved in cellulose biosynthesis